MTFRQLEVFLAIVREGSFSRAGQRIHLSQPTLSEHVRELERELGRPLFARRGRTVRLTEAGRVFEPYAARVLGEANAARQAVAELDGLGRGSLLLGSSTTPGVYLLPAVLAAFWRRWPGVEVTLRIANSRAIEAQVRAGELDLGVVGGHGLAPGERCLAAGLLDELVLVVGRGHPWARRRDVVPAALGAERVLVREPGSATREVTERALQRAGVRLGPTLQLDHTEAIKQAVLAGLGVAFVSRYAIRGDLASGRLAVVPVRGLRILRHFHVLQPEGRAAGAAVRAFIEVFETLGRAQLRPQGR